MGYSDLLDEADFKTIKALAECDMSAGRAGQMAHMSRSGIYYHSYKIERITGRSPLNFYDLMWFVNHMKDGRPTNEEDWYA